MLVFGKRRIVTEYLTGEPFMKFGSQVHHHGKAARVELDYRAAPTEARSEGRQDFSPVRIKAIL